MRVGAIASLIVPLNIASALAAFAAAAFWWLSASPLPPMVSYWGGAPADDPFFIALQESARLNGRAALCAAISAVLFGVATLIQRQTVATWLRG